jgi:hypothetical protein
LLNFTHARAIIASSDFSPLFTGGSQVASRASEYSSRKYNSALPLLISCAFQDKDRLPCHFRKLWNVNCASVTFEGFEIGPHLRMYHCFIQFRLLKNFSSRRMRDQLLFSSLEFHFHHSTLVDQLIIGESATF